MDDNQEFSKAALLRRIRDTRATLEQLIAPLSHDQLTATGPDGWSIKDHLAHLSAWRRKLLAMIEGRPDHEALQIDAATYESGDEDQINDLLYQRNRDRPLDEVLVEFRQVHEQVLAALEPMSEQDLDRQGYPDETDPNRKLIHFVVGNTFGHDQEHINWIQSLLAPRS